MRLNKIVSGILSAALFAGMLVMPAGAADTKLLAFPGAEGGGKYTTGARGTASREVYHVTNLNDSGAGSLRDAVSEEGRIVVFDISGIINLKSKLLFLKPNITVLGQTAPGDGITVSGYDAEVKADNIIIRYLRIRPTDSQGGEPDGLGGRWIDNIIIDHCSVSWGVDEMLTIYSGSLEDGKESENKAAKEQSKNVTVQYCLSSESLRMSNHFKGAHGYGGIIGGTNASYHHNMFAHHDSRNPRMDRNLKSTDMVNNVIYNFGNNGTYGAEPYSYHAWTRYSTPSYASNVNIRNNYYKYGPSTKQSIREKIFEATNSGDVYYNGAMAKSNFYINGNYVYASSDATANNTASENYVMNMNKMNLLSSPVNMGEYEIPPQTAEEAFEDVITNVGATLPRRDPIDARVVADAKNGTGRIINGINEVGGFTGIKSEKRTFEIPSEWKSRVGMTGAYSETDIVPGGTWAGYTWIEAYVNEWTESQSAPTNPDITVISPAVADLSKTKDQTGGQGFWNVVTEDQTVAYKASATPKSGTEISKIELYDGTTLKETVNSTSIDANVSLEAGVHYLTCKAYNNKGEMTTSPTSIVYVTKNDEIIGADTISEIGETSFPGKSNVWTKDDVTYIGGSGLISGKSDSFSYWKHPVTGDFEFSVKVESIPKFENGALCGIMFRESLDADSRMVMLSDGWKKYGQNIMVPMRSKKGESISFGWMKDSIGNDVKNDSNYDTTDSSKNLTLPKYLKIARSGDKLTLSVSNDGVTWTNNKRQPLTIDISGWSKNAYIGLAVDSINGDSNEATPMLPWYSIGAFSDIKMTGVTSYGITLDPNGGAVNSGNFTTYKYGDKTALPTDVTRSGYTFMGWHDNAEGEGKRYTSIPQTAAGNITLYADWHEGTDIPTPTPEPTLAPTATPAPNVTVPDGLVKISESRKWTFDGALSAPSNNINGLSLIQSSKAITFGSAEKTFNGVKYNSVMKFPGGGSTSGVCAAFFAEHAGTVNVLAAHPNGNNERFLVINNGTENRTSLTTTDLKLCTVRVGANTPVYVYSASSGLDVSAIEYIPDGIPPVTDKPTDPPSPPVTDKPTDSPTPPVTDKPTDPPTPPVTDKPTDPPSPTVTPTAAPSATPEPLPEVNVSYDKDLNSAVITSDKDAAATVIFACFDGEGRLISVFVTDAKLTKGTVTVGAGDDFDSNGTVKVYVWESLGGMRPFALK